MANSSLSKTAEIYLHKLCMEIDNRCVGSTGNHQATDFFAKQVAGFGFKTEKHEFDCIDWKYGEVRLLIDGKDFSALCQSLYHWVRPYCSPGRRIHAG